MVQEKAIKQFLSEVKTAQAAGILPNAQAICKQIFGDPVLESTINVVEECKRRGFLSRADLDYTGVALSAAGEAFLNS